MTLRRFAAVSCLGLLFASCKPLLDDGGPDVDNPATDTAWVQITNKIEVYPGTYRFFLFPASAANAEATNPADTIGDVAENATVVFHILPGIWKLAYQGPSQPIDELTDDAGSTTWPSVEVKKNTFYRLHIQTDGGVNSWSFQPL